MVAGGCKGSSAGAPPRPAGHAATRRVPMKGVELYSWQEEGEKRYAVLPGTNRIKSEGEIRAAALASLGDVEGELAKYGEGTEVFTVGDARVGGLAFAASADDLRELGECCRRLGLRLRAD